MRIKCFSLLILLLSVFSCSIHVERGDFSSVDVKKYYIHQDSRFTFYMPEDWDFLAIKDELDTVLKFTSGDRKINGYLKAYKIPTNRFNLHETVNDYFSKKKKCSFKSIFKSRANNIDFYLLKGIFRSVYPIVVLVFVKGNYLYELTNIYSLDENELEDAVINKNLDKITKVTFTLFNKLKFHETDAPRFRKRFGITFPCPKNWVFGLASSKGEISAIGYKDKIIILSLKLIRNMKNHKFKEINKELKKLLLEFKTKMKKKNYTLSESKSNIFGVRADLLIVSKIETENRDAEENTIGIVKKYMFVRNKNIYEFLVIYSAKDITDLIKFKIKRIIKSIKFS